MRWEKEPPRGERHWTGGALLPLLGLTACLLSILSFALFDESEGVGDVSRSVSYFEDFFDENESIAVFLGWEGTE